MEIEYGRILRVDLSSKRSWMEMLDPADFRKFIGGSGAAALLLFKLAKPDVDPLDPENPLILAVGPLCGTRAPTSGRHEVAALSPLTGLFAESDVGGAWGSAFRAAGWDFLVIEGASEDPVFILVTERGASIEPASGVWGKDTFQTAEYFSSAYPGSETACIGPAGEKLVKIAAIAHDGRDARMAGRCGLGAVMGSKRLKAVVAAPATRRPRALWDPEGFRSSVIDVTKALPVNTEMMARFGTAGSLGVFYEAGDVPVKNWIAGSGPLDIGKLVGQTWVEKGLLKKRFFCAQCPIGCGRVVELSDGGLGGGPEYETLSMLGPNLLIDDLGAVIAANELCNRLGLDTISAGGAIGFLMEAFERGETAGIDLGGIAPRWGDAKALLELVRLIGARDGVGALLGEGVARMSKVFGSPEYAIHVKGLEFPAHDPRAFNSMGLSYATANRGACHLQGMSYNYERRLTMPERGFPAPEDRFGTKRKVELVVATQDYMGLLDSLKLCKFSIGGGSSVTTSLEWLNLATGWGMDVDEYLKAGERIFNLKRMINVSRGVSRKDDTLPDRIKFQPKGGGAGQNLPPDLETSLDAYYRLRGWSEDGLPEDSKKEELGLFVL
ncbi:MAG TPA: aldehyde ferredoxin oxidoreductase family protein [Rectinemataceae bacterium]